jgi:hypothetical protein
MRKRIFYFLIGAGCALLAALLFDRSGRYSAGAVAMGGAIAVLIAWKKGKIPTIEEETRPTTLFPNGVPGPPP